MNSIVRKNNDKDTDIRKEGIILKTRNAFHNLFSYVIEG